jgi:hypothetical protein
MRSKLYETLSPCRALAAARRADEHGGEKPGSPEARGDVERADFMAQVRREHRAIVTAVAARDPKAARAAAIEHHLNGERRLITSGVIKPSRIPRR